MSKSFLDIFIGSATEDEDPNYDDMIDLEDFDSEDFDNDANDLFDTDAFE